MKQLWTIYETFMKQVYETSYEIFVINLQNIYETGFMKDVSENKALHFTIL